MCVYIYIYMYIYIYIYIERERYIDIHTLYTGFKYTRQAAAPELPNPGRAKAQTKKLEIRSLSQTVS